MIVPQAIPRLARRILPEDLRIRLRSSSTVRRLATFLFKGTAHCPFPNSQFELFYDGYRNIGVGADISHIEAHEQHAVQQLLRQTSPRVVWDIGANIGLWSLFLTCLCGPDTEVRCFEPDPGNLNLLELNKTRNKIDNWIIRPMALSNREGVSTFFSDPVCGATGSLNHDHDFIGRNFGAHRGEFQVCVTTVDSEISRGARPPEFMKIDVEGHELAVLEGALQTLRIHRPSLIFETTRNHTGVRNFFRQLDYQFLDLSGKEIDLPVFNTIAVPREASVAF